MNKLMYNTKLTKSALIERHNEALANLAPVAADNEKLRKANAKLEQEAKAAHKVRQQDHKEAQTKLSVLSSDVKLWKHDAQFERKARAALEVRLAQVKDQRFFLLVCCIGLAALALAPALL